MRETYERTGITIINTDDNDLLRFNKEKKQIKKFQELENKIFDINNELQEIKEMIKGIAWHKT